MGGVGTRSLCRALALASIAGLMTVPSRAPASPVVAPPDIWVADANGDQVKRLSASFFDTEPLQWSPDGTLIGFVNHDGIKALDLNGHEVVLTTNDLDRFATWSPEGERIAFSGHEGETEDIFVKTIGADDRRKLGSGFVGEHDQHPAWSPDGKWIAYIGGPGSGQPGRLNVLDLLGTQPRVSLPDAQYVKPQWSRDSTTIAYRSWDGEVVAWNHETGTSFRRAVEHFRWSPASDAMAYLGTDGRLVTIDGSGADERVLVPDDVTSFDWSPDGTKIAYTNIRDEIRVIDLTTREEVIRGWMELSSAEAIDWAPVGETMSFTDGHDLFVLDGTVQRNLTQGALEEHQVAFGSQWSPDASKVAFYVRSDPPPPPVYERSISLSLSDHLVAAGSIETDGPPACSAPQRIRLQRKVDGGWRRVRWARTDDDAGYRRELPDRPGRYRAVISKLRLSPDGHACTQAVSDVERHRH